MGQGSVGERAPGLLLVRFQKKAKNNNTYEFLYSDAGIAGEGGRRA